LRPDTSESAIVNGFRWTGTNSDHRAPIGIDNMSNLISRAKETLRSERRHGKTACLECAVGALVRRNSNCDDIDRSRNCTSGRNLQ
jgi:hypothetical protein